MVKIILPDSARGPLLPLDYGGIDPEMIDILSAEIHARRLGTTATAADCRQCHEMALAELRMAITDAFTKEAENG